MDKGIEKKRRCDRQSAIVGKGINCPFDHLGFGLGFPGPGIKHLLLVGSLVLSLISCSSTTYHKAWKVSGEGCDVIIIELGVEDNANIIESPSL